MSIEQRAHEDGEEVFAHGIKLGDTITIDGIGFSARGHKVLWGRSVKTGRKMKCVRLEVFVAGAVCTSPMIKPSIIEK